MKITFDELQVGDRVKVTYTQGSVACMRAGEVSAKSKFEALAEHVVLAHRNWDNLAIKLTERPLPIEKGEVFLATKVRGREVEVKMFVATDRNQVRYFSDTPIDSMYNHKAEHITAWEPIN